MSICRMRRSVSFFLVVSVLVFQGCALKKHATLSAGIAPAKVPELYDPKVFAPLIDLINNTTPADQQLRKRNDTINKIVIAVDNNYDNYKNAIYVGRAGFDTFADFVSLALTGATAVVGSAGTKAAFGAAATGVTGAHSSVNKNFFNDASRDALFSVMDALRSEELDTIQKNMKLDLAHYAMSDALVDLQRYYSVGTVTSARNAVSSASVATTPTPTPAAPVPPAPAPAPVPVPAPAPVPVPAPAPVPVPAPAPAPGATPPGNQAAAMAQPSPTPNPQAKFANRLKQVIQSKSQQDIK
jgi:hypothetical protein